MKLQKTTSKNLSEDKALQTLPSTASVNVEAVDKSTQEEIYAKAELAVANSLEGQTQEFGFQKKNEVSKEFSLHEVTCQISTESELSSEEQNQAITFMKHLNIGQTTETHPTNATEEQEKVPTSQRKQKLDIEGDGKFIHEEAKEIQEAEMQFTETATESVLEDEAQSTIPILPIVNGEGEEILRIQKPQEDENAAIDNDKTCRQENELEKKDIVKIPESPYICKKLESHFDSEAHYQTDEQLSQTKEESNNIPDQISESDGQIQQQKFKDENQIKPEHQIEGQLHFSTPLIAIPNSTASLRTEVNDKDDGAGESETIEEQQTTDSQLSLTIEEKVNQVKDRDVTNSKATESNKQKVTTQLSFENELTRKEAASQNSNKAINEAATGNLEIQEAEITQLGGENEEEMSWTK